MIRILNETSSAASEALQVLRDKELQQSAILFRERLTFLGIIIGYEISKTIEPHRSLVETVLGEAHALVPNKDVTIISILRAGNPVHQGLLVSFPESSSGFIGSMRAYDENHAVKIASSYKALPDVNNRVVILTDPMIATGGSIRDGIEKIRKQGAPKKIHVASIIAYRKNLEVLHKEFPDIDFWVAGVDDELNDKSYIVPGLGDAGDLAFGGKV